MKIYKLSQAINDYYDTYDSVIVCAKNKEEAKKIHPSGRIIENNNGGTWTSDLDKIKVEYLGKAKNGLKKEVILASFNAG